MREKIDVLEHAGEILGALTPGALVTVKVDGTVNPMTIGWGMLGIEWRKPIFIAYIRQDRYTHELLERADCFTVNVPVPTGDDGADRRVRRILGFCGSRSGRDTDKVAELGLTLVDGETVDAPAIRELPLTLECRIIYRRDQDTSLMPAELRDGIYGAAAGEGLCHTAYYGEVTDAYLLR